MYYEIIEKVKPFLETLIDNFGPELVYAYNLHSKRIQEEGGECDTAYIFHSYEKEDLKQAIDLIGTKDFYKLFKKSTEENFCFNMYGEILSKEEVRKLLFDNFTYYMYETLSEPWYSNETKELYKEIWEIIENNKYGIK